jgi:hypothetical protein
MIDQLSNSRSELKFQNGNKKRFPSNNLYQNDFLYHSNVKESDNFGKNGREKFGLGFQRKTISNCFNDDNQIKQIIRNNDSPKNGEITRKSIVNPSSYNLINGNICDHNLEITKSKGKRCCIDNSPISSGDTFNSKLHAEIQMHESSNRYFIPRSVSKFGNNRRIQIVTEGIVKPKYSSILVSGSRDLPSYGIEDQFSKSNYFQKSEKASNGLWEVTKSIK